jgi:hypothetical protein
LIGESDELGTLAVDPVVVIIAVEEDRDLRVERVARAQCAEPGLARLRARGRRDERRRHRSGLGRGDPRGLLRALRGCLRTRCGLGRITFGLGEAGFEILNPAFVLGFHLIEHRPELRDLGIRGGERGHRRQQGDNASDPGRKPRLERARDRNLIRGRVREMTL